MKPEVSLTCTQGTQQMPIMSHTNPISSAFAKLGKATLEFRHVCPSVRPSVRMEQLGSNWTDFSET